VALAAGKALSAGVRSFVQAMIIYLLAVLLGVKGKTSLSNRQANGFYKGTSRKHNPKSIFNQMETRLTSISD
jgi:hypothetical protein